MTKDALRAGSAEAKAYVGKYESHHGQDALRAGSAEAKDNGLMQGLKAVDALRAGSAEAKSNSWPYIVIGLMGCTPCRQRRGKGKPVVVHPGPE